jgi:cysteine synthase
LRDPPDKLTVKSSSRSMRGALANGAAGSTGISLAWTAVISTPSSTLRFDSTMASPPSSSLTRRRASRAVGAK